MTRASQTAASWLPEYQTDRDHLLLSRVRLMAGLAFPPALLLTAYMIGSDPTSMGLRVRLGAQFAAVFLGAWVLARTPWARRHALETAVVAVIALVMAAAGSWAASVADLEVAPLNALALILASTLVFPWGAVAQGIVNIAVVLGYLWAAGHSLPVANQGYAVGMMCTLTPVVMIGAGWIEGWRQASFRRTWEQSQLVALATDLAAALDVDHILDQALRHGGRIVAAETRTALLFHPDQQVFRIAAEQDDRVRETSWIGVEFPPDLDVAERVLTAEVVVLPRDLPASPVAGVLRDAGVSECVYVLMQHAGQTMGVLTFSRYRPVAFTAAERALMQAVAHQTAQALRNAELVSALRHANALKSEFVSTMSHELRTPLNVIIGFTEMLGDDDLPAVDRRDCLQRMDAAARDLLGLIEGTLEIGRLEADRDVVRCEWLDLAPFWRELGAACGRLSRAGAVDLRWSRVEAGLGVETDPRKLTVIVRNLVGNALKFTSQGSIRVDLQLDDAGIVVRVTDTGIGIAPNDQRVIFDMFRQADGSDARQYGGSGLGLYIVRRFAAQLGGTVEVESAPGEGATFTVRLPAVVQSRRAQAA